MLPARSLAILLVACKSGASAPRDAPIPEPKPGELRGTFALTYYWVATEAAGEPADTTLYDGGCAPIAKVSAAYAKELEQAGTGRLADKRVLGIERDCPCPRSPCVGVAPPEQPWGTGVENRPLVPFASVAVDRAVIPIGTRLYIQELDGIRLPSYFLQRHDGCVVADDTGARMKGERLDWFVGRQRNYRELDAIYKLTQVTVRDGGTRCP